MSLFFSATSSLAAGSLVANCETSFKFVELNSGTHSAPSPVYVLKFDAGAGVVRVLSGHIFMAERDSTGSMTSIEVFHDRGSGRYNAADVFRPLNWPLHSRPIYQWRKALGPDGYTPVHLIAGDRDGVRFIGRTEQGDLRFYHALELFPLDSSER